MRFVKSMLRRNHSFALYTGFVLLFFLCVTTTFAQENSPYARYGLGTSLPASNVVNRAMGGISAAYSDPLSINFNNPASYAHFQVKPEQTSKRIAYGRVLCDVGINFENKTLHESNNPQKFSGSYGSFSHVQLGIPLRKNWSLSFGLRQLNRISYKVAQTTPL